MVVPTYEQIMLPLLQHLGGGKERKLRDIIESLAHEFSLSDDDRRELLPSGKQTRFANRVGWAGMHLKKAGLLENSQRGWYRITTHGLDALKQNLNAIDVEYLKQFPSYIAFQGTYAPNIVALQETGTTPSSQTPEDLLETSYLTTRTQLALDLLDRIKQASPQFFEQLVLDVLVAMGYGGSRRDAAEAVGKSGDGGIDGIIKEDRLGLDVIYIQAKRWQDTVGRPIIQAFAGSLEMHKARKGVFITTSHFADNAHGYVRQIEKKIVLIDGEQLAQLMIEYGVGVTPVQTYVVKRIDEDYFDSVE